jgi:predicted nucleotidyltransferase
MNTSTQEYIEELRTNPQILGIILFGSWARGNNRSDSDVDLLVIVQQGFKRTVEYREGQAFEITYTTEQEAIAYWQSNPDDAIELWNIAKVLFDRDETVVRLQKAASELKEKGKPPLTDVRYEHYKFDAHDQLKAIAGLAASDTATARMLLSTKVFQLTELFFDTRQLWTPPPKQRLVIIKDLNHNLYSLIGRYYDESSLVEQINIVQSIIMIVFDR